jgi:hypothetical protein
MSSNQMLWTRRASPLRLFEIALVLVRLDHVAGIKDERESQPCVSG